ncbi:MAG: SMP-30/gluconolactonase/LRE family protein [Chlamydiae bacterium]|nr:SMP-30/gluconolactonase/LRE family protein [Chlamydiota bacterium]
MLQLSLFSACLLISSTLQGVITAPSYVTADSPQLPLEVYSEEFAHILGTKPKLFHLAEGFGFTEGPVYFSQEGKSEGYLLFTDQINDNINLIKWYGTDPFNTITELSWSKPVVFRHPSNIADGQTADLQGRLLTAETTGRRVSVTESNGVVNTLVGFYDGKPLNSPNDLVVKSDGTVWFTDPGYGCLQFPQDCYLPSQVYRYDPSNQTLLAIIKDLEMPNGIAFSPDEKVLYVIDSGAIQAPRTLYVQKPHVIYAYDVIDDKNLINKRVFTEVSPGFPDGMRLDENGNVYVGALDGVQVFNPKGKLIGKILMPKETANLTFGGAENNILFICSSDSVWAIRLNTRGAKPVAVLKKRGL